MIDVDWRCAGIASACAASLRSLRPQLKVLTVLGNAAFQTPGIPAQLFEHECERETA